jgi:SpoVK/Ycf46/Vps4 family AAA+-type ATPase
MQEFDKLPNDVIVIGATNRIDRIDEALLRRFSMEHEVKVLMEAEKTSMVEKFLKDINVSIPEDEILTMVRKNANQSMLLNDLIRTISEKIAAEVA